MHISDFCDKYRIRMNYKIVDSNPNMMSEMPPGTKHYKVRLRRYTKSLTTYFSMGPALKYVPTPEDVLSSLQLEAQSVENTENFREWCGNFGLDPENTRNCRGYNTSVKLRDKLRKFLGSELYSDILYEVEGL